MALKLELTMSKPHALPAHWPSPLHPILAIVFITLLTAFFPTVFKLTGSSSDDDVMLWASNKVDV